MPKGCLEELWTVAERKVGMKEMARKTEEEKRSPPYDCGVLWATIDLDRKAKKWREKREGRRESASSRLIVMTTRRRRIMRKRMG
jgi:hypothetical protein